MGIAKVAGVGLVGVVLVGAFLGYSSNSYIEPYQTAERQTSQVQNVINARWNKVTANSQIVDRYAAHEQGTFVGTANGRGGAGLANNNGPKAPAKPAALSADPNKVMNDPNLQAQLGQADQQLVSYVNAAVEAYPELKADKLFSDMMTEINGATNRVTVERKRMLDAIMNYDVQVSHFPGSLTAWIMGYHKLPYYTADASQQEVNDNMFKR